jgi:diacylglycerol kinase family enzyme
MRRAVLLFNPHSGRHPHKRLHAIETIAMALRSKGLAVEVTATEGPGTAGQQARIASEQGADILFACGGDGTIHEILQGLAFQPHTALGIVPLGSANALARHLSLPPNPVDAALAQLDFAPQTLPLGHIEYTTPDGVAGRYFLVMAGAGADGELVRTSMRALKRRFGSAAYHVRAARLFMQTRFAACDVHLQLASGEILERRAVGIMAVRGSDLCGILGPRSVRGALPHPHLAVTLLRPPMRLSLLAWLAAGWIPLPGHGRFVETFEVESLTASAGHSHHIPVEADGEWLGVTPVKLRVVPDALRLLLPPITSPPAP